jgi:hypothetical protein
MRAVLKSLHLDPDPSTLPGDPSQFSVLARMVVGPANSPIEEEFDVIVCTPEWLSQAINGCFYDARHHVVVNRGAFDAGTLRAWLARRVMAVQADTWDEIGERLARLGYPRLDDDRTGQKRPLIDSL